MLVWKFTKSSVFERTYFKQQLPPRLAAQLYQPLGQVPPRIAAVVAKLAPLGAMIVTPSLTTTSVLAAAGQLEVAQSRPTLQQPVG